MKLCDRCRVSGCCLTYLGAACAYARKQECPEIRPNRAELISSMSLDELAQELVLMLTEFCEDGIPSEEYMKEWLLQPPDEEVSD